MTDLNPADLRLISHTTSEGVTTRELVLGDVTAGYWGIALGTAIGVPLAAAEPLIRAAVFGLFWPSTLIEAARRITIPIEFDLQWDDEDIPREGGLALFGGPVPRAAPARLIDATPDEVFDSMTKPEQFHRWFGAQVDIEPYVGGRFAMGGFELDPGGAKFVEFEPGRKATLRYRSGVRSGARSRSPGYPRACSASTSEDGGGAGRPRPG